ncbi:MAG: thioredoxin family protein [Candidatus Omnitrophica bacterium]|nr:thioredoxin family protein [Candidatus Omnitrophota bacterium]
MALLESIKVPLGSLLPAFELKDPDGRCFKSEGLAGERGLLVVFTCNHCPYAQAVWPRVIRLGEYAKGMRVGVVDINPNINPDYPDDSPEKMRARIQELAIPFPYLVDEGQLVARTFKAQCTPDIFLYNNKRELVYHGRIDDNWKDESAVTREDLKEAMNNMVSGLPQEKRQYPSMGCSIKWNSIA